MKKKVIIAITLALVLAGTIAATKHIITSDCAHLLDGTVWQSSLYVASLGTTGSTDGYLIKTPATNEYHLTWELHATGGVYAYIYEAPTINATQTASTVYCKNRIKDTANPVSFWADGYFTLGSAGSTVIRSVLVGSGSRLGGFGASQEGWILKASTYYYILLTAKDNNPAYSLALHWHQHD